MHLHDLIAPCPQETHLTPVTWFPPLKNTCLPGLNEKRQILHQGWRLECQKNSRTLAILTVTVTTRTTKLSVDSEGCRPTCAGLSPSPFLPPTFFPPPKSPEPRDTALCLVPGRGQYGPDRASRGSRSWQPSIRSCLNDFWVRHKVILSQCVLLKGKCETHETSFFKMPKGFSDPTG